MSVCVCVVFRSLVYECVCLRASTYVYAHESVCVCRYEPQRGRGGVKSLLH